MNDYETGNEVPQTMTNADLSDWENAPLFNQNLISQITNAEPQITVSPASDSSVILEIGVREENFQTKSFGVREIISLSPIDRQVAGTAKFVITENEAPQTENHESLPREEYEVPQTAESAIAFNSDNEMPQIPAVGCSPAKTTANAAVAPPPEVKTGAARNRQSKLKNKAAKKPSKKQTYSKKREVVPVKVFVTPAEKIVLEAEVAARGTSFSNFVRLRLGLSPNQTGRKKQIVEAAFDWRELGFDDEFSFD